MSVINSQPLIGASGQGGGYNLTKSLRFRSSASAYLNRTFSAGNRQTWTWSAWVKRGTLGAYQGLFGQGTGTAASGYGFIRFDDNDVITISASPDGGTSSITWTSTPVYRDPSAWYHIVAVLDTTQATGSNRFKLYVNNVQQSGTFSTTPTQNSNIEINRAAAHQIGVVNASSLNNYFDGYMAEVNYIDGQALTPSSFGETSTTTGVWQPKKYTGTYGTNGFYLPFTDTTSTSTLGTDFSGNSNTWTVNNISLTAGSTYDSMNDVPTLTSATTANYCVMNPLVRTTNNGGSITQADGNLSSTIGSYANTALATIGVTSGKWYWEMTPTATNNGAYFYIGIAALGFNSGLQPSQDPLQWAYYAFNGNKNNNNNVAYGASYTTNDVIGVALDMDTGTLTFYKNNTSQGVAYSSGLTGYTMFPMCSFGNTGSITVVSNFGQRPFAYTPPTGFVALNTFNLPTPTIGATASTIANEYFDVSLWTGNGTSQSITNSGSMQPDFVWYKGRSTTFNHGLFDSIRGTLQRLSSNLTSAESTTAGSLTAFNSNGFSVGSDAGANQNTDTYVGWQWRASNATAVTNTSGSITSTVSASTTAGFSIVTYTGTGANATVGHGLGVAPKMIIIKNRGDVSDWAVWHTGLSGNSYYIYLNKTSAQSNVNAMWNNTAPTSTVFSLGTSTDSNDTKAMVAYCFAQVAGYSAFGSYTGNGSTDGTMVFTGFRPRFVMVKRTDSAANWIIDDSTRNPSNIVDLELYPSLSNAESSDPSYDFLSNGFKLRVTSSNKNASGGTYIYMAFAEVPFKYSLGR